MLHKSQIGCIILLIICVLVQLMEVNMRKFITILTVLTIACTPVSVFAASSPEATTIEPTTDQGNTNEDPSNNNQGGNQGSESPQTGNSALPFVLLVSATGATLIAKKKLA